MYNLTLILSKVVLGSLCAYFVHLDKNHLTN